MDVPLAHYNIGIRYGLNETNRRRFSTFSHAGRRCRIFCVICPKHEWQTKLFLDIIDRKREIVH